MDGSNFALLCDDAFTHANHESLALVVNEVMLNALQESLVELDVPLHLVFEVEVHGRVAGV